jgi:hypothetical protein
VTGCFERRPKGRKRRKSEEKGQIAGDWRAFVATKKGAIRSFLFCVGFVASAAYIKSLTANQTQRSETGPLKATLSPSQADQLTVRGPNA